MGRHLIQLSFFPLLGAIVNVAVAWGCVAAQVRDAAGSAFPSPLTGRPISEVERVSLIAVGLQPQPRRHHCFDFVFEVWPSDGYGWGERRVVETEMVRLDCDLLIGSHLGGYEILAGFVDAGWPMRSLSGLRYLHDRSTVRAHDALLLERTTWTGERMVFPHRPIWPGFAINTLFYAGILWLAWGGFAAPFALRRRRRIKRGLCPACAYPVGESDVCTECGAAVPLSLRERARVRARTS
jgi:hypothetical protein